jgi:polysaccharide chain length determinant protein (PEP-CTERM system associated)
MNKAMINKPAMEVEDYLEIFRRRRLAFILPFILILIVTITLVVIIPPVYRSEASLFIERQEIPSDLVETTVTGYVEERIKAITKRLLTNENLWRIAEKLDLYPEERNLANQLEIVQRMRESVLVEMESVEEADDPNRRRNEPSVTIGFKVSYDASTPEIAQKVANELAVLYAEENRKERTEQTQEVSRFLEKESSRYRAQIAQIDRELATFKQENAGYLPELAKVNLDLLNKTGDQLDQVQENITSLQEQIASLQSQLSATDPYYNVVGDANSMTVNQQLRVLKSQYMEARQRYSDAHPDIKRLKSQIESLGGSINASSNDKAFLPDNPAYIALNSQVQSSKIRLKALETERERLKKKIDTYEDRVFKAPAVEKDYPTIVRDQDAALEKFRDIQGKLQTARLANNLEQGAKAERFVILSPASLPNSPAQPNRIAIMFLGFVLAFGAGTGTASLAEYLDPAVHGVRGVRNIFLVPPLAEIPYIESINDTTKKKHRFILILCFLTIAIALILAVVHFFLMPFDQVFIEQSVNGSSSDSG